MLIKNKIYKLISFLLISFLFNLNLYAEEFNITAKEIKIDKENETLIAEGLVEAVDSQGTIITSNKITYTKSKEFILAEGNVNIEDVDDSLLKNYADALREKDVASVTVTQIKDVIDEINADNAFEATPALPISLMISN